MIDRSPGPRPPRYRGLQAAFWLAERCSWRHRLDVVGMERQAREITGRQFLGTADLPRLERLVASIRDEVALNALGRVAAAGSIVRMLVTRLCMEEIRGASRHASSAGSAAMTGWIAENPQGRHRYSLEQFGLDDRRVRSACAAYDAQERSLAVRTA